MNPRILNIWFDILTPKQLLFFEPMIKRLSENNMVMATTRDYMEATGLAKVRGVRMRVVGKHGGGSLLGKLRASVHRIGKLTEIVSRFGPDLTISFCSPEAIQSGQGNHERDLKERLQEDHLEWQGDAGIYLQERRYKIRHRTRPLPVKKMGLLPKNSSRGACKQDIC